MLDKDDLQAIAELLKPIYDKLGSVDGRLNSLDDRMDRVENKAARSRVRLRIGFSIGPKTQAFSHIPFTENKIKSEPFKFS